LFIYAADIDGFVRKMQYHHSEIVIL